MSPGRMSATFVVPFLRNSKDAVEVLVGRDAKCVEYLVFDCLDYAFNVALQIR